MSIYSTDHLGAVSDVYAGPSTGFWENAKATFNQQYRVDSMDAVLSEVDNDWSSSLKRYEELTGDTESTNYAKNFMGTYIAVALGQETPWIAQSSTVSDEELRRRATEFDSKIKALGDPNVKALAEIVQGVVDRRAVIEGNTSDITSRETGFGWIGGLLGGAAGSLSPRDPFNLATLGFGGFGKSVATRIATEAGIGGLIEGVNQLAFIQPTRAYLGEEERSPWDSILYAAAGAGIVRGLGEGLIKGGGFLAERLDRQGFDPTADAFDLSDDQLRSMFNRADTPSSRAGVHALDSQEQFNALNPYTPSDSGMRRFIGELTEVQEIMAGRTSTAIRQLPVEQLPLDLDNLSFEMHQVKETAPVVYEQFSAAQAKLDAIDAQLADAEAKVASINQADGIDRIDPDTAELARSYMRDLDNPNPQVRATAQRQLESIAQTLGPAKIAKETSDASIAPRKELQALRQSRKAALKEFKKTRDAVDAQIELQQQKARLAELTQQKKSTGGFGLFAKAEGEPYVGPLTEHATVKSAYEGATTAQESIPPAAQAIAEADEGIDLGNGVVLPKDFSIELVDEFGNRKQMSAKEIFDELADDDKLVAAMGQCAL